MIESKVITFITLAKELNYTKTAEILSMTQPAVSQQIKSIEDEFSIKLFYHKGKVLLLTEEGKLLLRYCTRLDSLDKAMHTAINDYKTNLVHLDIGLTPSTSEYLVPQILKIINEDQKTNISIHIHPIKELYERMDTYEFDFLIGDEVMEDQNEHNYIKIFDDYLVFVAGPTNKFVDKKNIDITELREEPLVLRHPKSTTRNQFASFLILSNDNISNYNVVLEIESIPIIKDLVSIDYGVSVLPYSVCQKEIDEGKLKVLDVKNFNIKRSTYIIYRKDAELKQIIVGFAKKIKKA
jgi:Transcriptional regulator